MSRKILVDQGGQRFTMEYEDLPATAEKAASSRWNVTLGFTAITTLPASSKETDSDAREQLIRWLDGHPGLHPTASDYLGGG
ncbi:MAG: hypothetical protein ABJD11_02190 [Gemmatimonadota bacterium]